LRETSGLVYGAGMIRVQVFNSPTTSEAYAILIGPSGKQVSFKVSDTHLTTEQASGLAQYILDALNK
jgi:hypothetical protein